MSSFITNSSKTSNSDSPTFYADEVPVADLVYSFDWSSTPLGPMEEWDPSFRMAVDNTQHAQCAISIQELYHEQFVSMVPDILPFETFNNDLDFNPKWIINGVDIETSSTNNITSTQPQCGE
ncbi:18828_t:CDS:2, partial [Entrophospora sp. SA101]